MSETAAASISTAGSPGTLGQLLQPAISVLASRASEMVEDLTGKLERAARDMGPAERGGMAAVETASQGKSPVWAAIKGGWAGAGTKVKVLTILMLLLLIVLLPVSLLVLMLALLILWIREAVS